MLQPVPTRFRPGAKAVILHQGKILVVKERLQRTSGEEVIHDFPGGGIELGETVEEGLKREVYEEVGLRIEVVKPLGSWDLVVEKTDENGYVHIICLAFQCRVKGETALQTGHNPAEGEDIFAANWLTPEEVQQIPVSDWPADVKPALANLDLSRE